MSTQFPFRLVLHVGNLNLYRNRTLKIIHECYIISGEKKLHGRTPGGAIIHHKQLCDKCVCARVCTLVLRRNSSSGIRLSSVFIFLLTGSSSCGIGGWAGGMGAGGALGGWGTGGAGTNATGHRTLMSSVRFCLSKSVASVFACDHLTCRHHHGRRSRSHDGGRGRGHRYHADARGVNHGGHRGQDLTRGQTHHRSHGGPRDNRHGRNQGGAYWRRNLLQIFTSFSIKIQHIQRIVSYHKVLKGPSRATKR